MTILKNCLAEKDLKIAKLEEKILCFELKLNEIANFQERGIECKSGKLENSKTNNLLNDKIKDIEEIQTNLISESGKYKCNKCDFTTYYKGGFKYS